MSGQLYGAFDPDLDLNPGPSLSYWVEAEFANGSVSSPGPVAVPTVPQTGFGSGFNLTVPGLSLSTTGTKAITFNGQQVAGSDLTWSWSPFTPPDPPVYIYYVTVHTAQGPAGPPTLAYQGPLKSNVQPSFHVMTTVNAQGPPFTFSLPSGALVQFCVSPVDIGALVAAGLGLPPNTSCKQSQVP
jgi:hypothetical protein